MRTGLPVAGQHGSPGVARARGLRAGRRAGLARHAWPAVAGLLLGLLALGPALGRGFVLTYDMVFVPDPPISLADLGFSGGPARAVPSDLVVALVARVLPAQFVQKLILLGIFVLACTGAAALLAQGWRRRDDEARLPVLAGLVGGVLYAWNPFVAERLIMGQWAMLLGYAGLPWVLRELCRRDGELRIWWLALAVVPAAVGGFAAMSITVVAALPTALCLRRRGVDRVGGESGPSAGAAGAGPSAEPGLSAGDGLGSPWPSWASRACRG